MLSSVSHNWSIEASLRHTDRMRDQIASVTTVPNALIRMVRSSIAGAGAGVKVGQALP